MIRAMFALPFAFVAALAMGLALAFGYLACLIEGLE